MRVRLLKWAVAALSLTLLAWAIDWRGSLALLARVDPRWALAACALDLSCILVSSWKWGRLLRALRVRVPLRTLFRAYWIGAFAGSFLPSTVGGDVARGALVRGAAGTAPVAASILVERLTGFAVLLALALAALLARPDLLAGASAPLHAAVVVAVACGCAALAVLTALLLRGRPLPWLGGGAAGGRVRAALARVGSALADYARQGRALLVACAASVAFYLLIALFQLALLRAVGAEVAPHDALAVSLLVTLAAALPISVNGIGTSEGAFVLLYMAAGLTPEQALAAALLRRLVLSLTALAGGLLWLTTPAAAAADRRPARGTDAPAAAFPPP